MFLVVYDGGGDEAAGFMTSLPSPPSPLFLPPSWFLPPSCALKRGRNVDMLSGTFFPFLHTWILSASSSI